MYQFFKFFTVFIVLYLHSTAGSAQKSLNLDFEIKAYNTSLPKNWTIYGDGFKIALDSLEKHSGKYSLKMESPEVRVNNSYGIYNGRLPIKTVAGKMVEYKGWIKTKAVKNGYAGLWFRVDGENQQSLGFDNMYDRGLMGDNDWTQVSIKMEVSEEAKTIIFGGLFPGEGAVWFDDLQISIVQKNDHEFDKGSNITIDPSSDVQIENLNLLGLIWGFLKYYHPNIRKGHYNWDYELFRILPKMMNSKNTIQRDEILAKWILTFGGTFEKKEESTTNFKIKMNPDLDWINDSGLSSELSSLLIDIKDAKRTEENYYAHNGLNYPNFKFQDEKPYSTMSYPDIGFRLLALYRYWNIIQYHFPYKYLIEEDWKNVLKEFIPKIVNAKNETEYTLTMLELIGRVHDSHADIYNNAVLTDYFGKYNVPVELTFIENKPVITGYFEDNLGMATGLETGDILTKINHVPVADKIKNYLKYAPASNYDGKLRKIAQKLLRTNDSVITVEFIRNQEIQKKVIKTHPTNTLYANHKDSSFKMLHKDIAYIHNGLLQHSDLPQIWGKIQPTKGLIIDDRNYPSDFPIYELCHYLMPTSLPFCKFSDESTTTPGQFMFKNTLTVGEKNDDYYKGQVIILVNQITQSSAEFHAMAYRMHPNAMVIGSTTAGADGNICIFSLPGGINTAISGIGVYYPDGSETQRIGIIPDVEIRPTIRGVKEGRDEVLEKAIEIITQQK